MVNKHSYAVSLEHIVCNVYGCDRAGVGGLADADAIERKPLLAAILALSPAYLHTDKIDEVSEFFHKYGVMFDYPEENPMDDAAWQEYVSTLRSLVNKYVKAN